MPAETFAAVLAELRTARGWSQGKLGIEAEIDHSYVSRIERGERMPHRPAVLALAEALEATERDTDRLLVAAGFLPLSPRVLGALRLAMEAL